MTRPGLQARVAAVLERQEDYTFAVNGRIGLGHEGFEALGVALRMAGWQDGQAALDWWPLHFPQTVQRGTLVVAPQRDEAELARFARRTTGHERIDEAAIAGLEPDLAGRFPIETIALGTQGLVVSRQGLGCMGMSDFYGPTDDAEWFYGIVLDGDVVTVNGSRARQVAVDNGICTFTLDWAEVVKGSAYGPTLNGAPVSA